MTSQEAASVGSPLGGDKGYEASEFISDLFERNVTPHIQTSGQNGMTAPKFHGSNEKTKGAAKCSLVQRPNHQNDGQKRKSKPIMTSFPAAS
ncbi:MAG: hypothetical protein HQL44_05380 [Alphaproteobacteria bacterium]|nr:hypothetical protein [Alphaproteobacteria bacterium]